MSRLLIRALVAVLEAPGVLTRLLTCVPAVVDGQRLDPRTRLFLSLIRLDPVARHRLPVARQRAEIELLEVTTSRAPAPGSIDEVSLDLPGRRLTARVYRPPGASAEALPGLLYLHGGGWVTGSAAAYDTPCSRIAHDCGAVVVSLDYRLAPEHPFPAALDDAIDALRWLRHHATALGIDPARISVGGDSAGGNLAAVVSQSALQSGEPLPHAQVLIYPAVHMSSTLPSRALFAKGFFLSTAHVEWFHDQYQPDRGARDDPRLSPLLTPDLGGLPPALVVTAGLDPIRDEGRAYAQKLSAAGVRVEHVEVEGMVHGFITLDRALPAADAAMTEFTRRLRPLLGGT